MGLTNKSTGAAVNEGELVIHRETPDDKVIALAGNPNVGKSTVFNGLTGLNQHTGNWPGKTVCNAQGKYKHKDKNFILVDIPGTYSLMANSVEEEVARDFICFGSPDMVVVVADATCLERNLNLVLQILEITQNVVVCVNLLDEAKKKKIEIDLDELSLQLGVPVVGASARAGKGLDTLVDAVYDVAFGERRTYLVKTVYESAIENAVSILEPAVSSAVGGKLPARWVTLKVLDADKTLLESLRTYLGFDIMENDEVKLALSRARAKLSEEGVHREDLRDHIVSTLVQKSEGIYGQCVTLKKADYYSRDRKIDKILTSKATGIPIMLLLLGFIFWLTISGANYPSELLSNFLFWIQDKMTDLCTLWNVPAWIHDPLVLGLYRTLAWVVSVMLPPMAIFFPLFTLLEDLGYLPRVAFNMDKFFKKASAHGKQSLTMCQRKSMRNLGFAAAKKGRG